MGFFDKLKKSIASKTSETTNKFKEGLAKTRNSFVEKIEDLIFRHKKIDEDFYEELEEILISADVGVRTVLELLEQLRSEVKKRKIEDAVELKPIMSELLLGLISEQGQTNQLNLQEGRLNVILVVGVNGVGKTTSIGKLANKLKQEGKKVILAAGDTFRAGAIEQLEIWGQRVDVDVIKHQAGADPAAVIFDAIQSAKSKQADILICDTAGRLHNKVNLMQELNKIYRVIQREIPDGPHEVLLALDATTGQNALQQAKLFKEAAEVSGIILTKLDGTAKGGIVIAISHEMQLPVKFVTLGEKVDDIQSFDPEQFINALFAQGFLPEE